MMKPQSLFLVVAICCGVLSVSCDRQSPLTLIVSPVYGVSQTAGIYHSSSGLPVWFSLKAQSRNAELKDIRVMAFDTYYSARQLLDTTLVGHSSATVDWQYTLPFYNDTTPVRLTFTVTATDGQSLPVDIVMYVAPAGDGHITSTEIVSMYSAASGNRSGFNFSTLSTCFPELHTDSAWVIYDLPQPDTTRWDEISRRWSSSAGICFAKGGSFDYGNATVASIQATYNTMLRDNTVLDICSDDVIFVGDKQRAFGVIKIISVCDEPGVANDRYIFSAKTFLTGINR